MTVILPHDPRVSGPSIHSAKSDSKSISSETLSTSAQRQSLEVAINTLEGDRFTLSSEQVSVSANATYSGLTQSGRDLTVAQANIEASASASRVAMALQGNLSPEEGRDTAKGIREIIKVLRDVEAGHTQQAANRVGRLSKLDTLTGVEASYTSAAAVEIKVSGSID
jgi:hypothetical protein